MIIHAKTLDLSPFEQMVKDGWNELRAWKQQFLRVSIPGRVISTRAQPFSASDSELVFNQCTSCGTCGLPNVLVRRTDDRVFWIANPCANSDNVSLLPNEAIIFDKSQYQKVLKSGNVEELPSIGNTELGMFLATLDFPEPRAILYCQPECREDPLAKKLVEAIRRAIVDHVTEIRFARGPAIVTEISLGLDLEGYPEAIWHVGKSDDSWAIRFLSNPEFPVWLTSSLISEALQRGI